MSGASGFVGSKLRQRFENKGRQVIALGRTELALPTEELARLMRRVNCIVNLAGAPVIHRWSQAYKKVMVQSRVALTRKLVNACALLDAPPQVFLSASAIGCYPPSGTHSEKIHCLTNDFLGNLVRDWEHEAMMARGLGIRTAVFRFGVVLGPGGGALTKMLVPFRLGLGGRIGSGKQSFSWIHLQDLERVFEEALQDTSYEGIYNLTSPSPTTNTGLTRVLSKVLARPAILPVPEFVLQILFGEGAQVLTTGQAVIPQRLLDRGFHFDFPTLDKAVADCVARS